MFEKAYLIIQLLPVLIQIMKQVEEAIPAQGAGEQKLAAVRGILESIYGLSGKGMAAFTEIWPVLENSASVLVEAFNNTGIFSRKAK